MLVRTAKTRNSQHLSPQRGQECLGASCGCVVCVILIMETYISISLMVRGFSGLKLLAVPYLKKKKKPFFVSGVLLRVEDGWR